MDVDPITYAGEVRTGVHECNTGSDQLSPFNRQDGGAKQSLVANVRNELDESLGLTFSVALPLYLEAAFNNSILITPYFGLVSLRCLRLRSVAFCYCQLRPPPIADILFA